MKKSIILAFAIIATTVAQAQFSYSKKAHIALGTYLDPGATLDHKGITGKTAYNGSFDAVYTSRYLNLRVSTERFPVLDNYRDLMFAFGLNYQVGYWGDLQITVAPRFGWAWRDINGVTGMRVNMGIEAGAAYWITKHIAITTVADYTKRNDQELRGYTPQRVLSVKVGMRVKLKNLL